VCVLQLQEQLRSDQARLSVEQARLESWQGQLGQQQATIEQLEEAAEEALGEAREAAAAAMAERDKVRCRHAHRGSAAAVSKGSESMRWCVTLPAYVVTSLEAHSQCTLLSNC
jgi:septal ring factor EnvC (AmiA/AmiB activator)